MSKVTRSAPHNKGARVNKDETRKQAIPLVPGTFRSVRSHSVNVEKQPLLKAHSKAPAQTSAHSLNQDSKRSGSSASVRKTGQPQKRHQSAILPRTNPIQTISSKPQTSLASHSKAKSTDPKIKSSSTLPIAAPKPKPKVVVQSSSPPQDEYEEDFEDDFESDKEKKYNFLESSTDEDDDNDDRPSNNAREKKPVPKPAIVPPAKLEAFNNHSKSATPAKSLQFPASVVRLTEHLQTHSQPSASKLPTSLNEFLALSDSSDEEFEVQEDGEGQLRAVKGEELQKKQIERDEEIHRRVKEKLKRDQQREERRKRLEEKKKQQAALAKEEEGGGEKMVEGHSGAKEETTTTAVGREEENEAATEESDEALSDLSEGSDAENEKRPTAQPRCLTRVEGFADWVLAATFLSAPVQAVVCVCPDELSHFSYALSRKERLTAGTPTHRPGLLTAEGAEITTLSPSSAFGEFFTGLSTGSVAMWQLQEQSGRIEHLGTLSSAVAEEKDGEEEPVTAIAVSPDRHVLCAGYSHCTVKVWHAPSPAIVQQPGPPTQTAQQCFSPPTLLCDPLELIGLGMKVGSAVTGVVLGPPDAAPQFAVLSGDDGSLVRYPLSPHSSDLFPPLFFQYKCPLTSIAQSPSGLFVCAGAADGSVPVYALLTATQLTVLHGPLSRISAVSFLDEDLIAAVSWDCSLTIWDFSSATLLHRLQVHSALGLGLALSHDTRLLCTSSRDETVALVHRQKLQIWGQRSTDSLASLTAAHPPP